MLVLLKSILTVLGLHLVLLQIEFYGDFDGSFHKKLDLMIDLSAALLGPRSHRYFHYVAVR